MYYCARRGTPPTASAEFLHEDDNRTRRYIIDPHGQLAAEKEALGFYVSSHPLVKYGRELDGLSYDEIAKVMDCPIGTVRSRIFRAREAIEKSIAGV